PLMITLERVTGTTSLAARVVSAGAAARLDGAPVLVSFSQPVATTDAIDFFDAGQALSTDRIYWAAPGGALVFVGVGVARAFTAAGPQRFAEVARAWSTLLATLPGDSDAGAALPSAGPTLLGGFSFEPQGPATADWAGFPAGRMVLPRFLLTVTNGQAVLTTAVVVEPDSDPVAEAVQVERDYARVLAILASLPASGMSPHRSLYGRGPSSLRVTDVRAAADWQAAVAGVARDIRAGSLEKVVLAREVQVEAGQVMDPATTLRHLRRAYPDCYGFAIAQGGSCFVSATPERLVSLADGKVQTTCLAGSSRRGQDAADDFKRGAALLASAKDREEHAVVARVLIDALAAVCGDVQAPAMPGLLRLRNVQHLYTPIRGHLRNGTSLLELVARLHPTPAVGGFPREAALARIRACEGLDRGWYAGPVGWLDSHGAGEFAVALRSALLHGNTARAFAGCGIMADSDPAAEYAETEIKLRAVLAALEEAAR
ncbi:MAG TPA: isochorismate synthase, partial [Chloroflexia bacterium]|nr:isochorismate synthase [Chloroflexia bacterium]